MSATGGHSRKTGRFLGERSHWFGTVSVRPVLDILVHAYAMYKIGYYFASHI